MKKHIKKTLGLALLFGISILPAHAKTIEIAAIDWCPQLCPGEEKQGFIKDIVDEVYSNSEFNLSYKFYPWTRAIGLVESGRAHILLSPAKEEAPDLLYPDIEVGVQEVCFFTKSDSIWTYTGLQSLDGIKAGAYKDGAYGEIDDYIKANRKQFQFMIANPAYLGNNLKKMNAGRIDAVLYTKTSAMIELAAMGVSNDYREAGCVTKDNLYVAFTPKSKDSETVQLMMDFFDKRMMELKESGKIAEIMNKYGLEDWSQVNP